MNYLNNKTNLHNANNTNGGSNRLLPTQCICPQTANVCTCCAKCSLKGIIESYSKAKLYFAEKCLCVTEQMKYVFALIVEDCVKRGFTHPHETAQEVARPYLLRLRAMHNDVIAYDKNRMTQTQWEMYLNIFKDSLFYCDYTESFDYLAHTNFANVKEPKLSGKPSGYYPM